MRSYGTEPQIWGGDGSCGDEHEWGEFVSAGMTGGSGKETITGGTRVQQDKMFAERRSALCRRCHAWRGELGQEPLPCCGGWARGEPPEACTQGCFIDHLRLVMAGLRRVLRDDGLCFVELGDGYASGGTKTTGRNDGGRPERDGGWRNGKWSEGKWTEKTYDIERVPVRRDTTGIPAKSLLLVPERFRLAMLSDGWTVRSVVRWAKKAPMPESCRDRFTSAVSEVVMLSKGSRYYSDFEAVKERTEPWNSAKGFSPNGQALRNIEGRIGNRDDKEQSGRNPRNYAFFDPDEWIPPDWVHLSPEPNSLSLRSVRRVRVEPGDASDGTERITSPDCPVHGDRPDRVANAGRGEPQDDTCLHSLDSDGRLAPEPCSESGETRNSYEGCSSPSRRDDSVPGYARSATGHSTETRRTDPVPATSLSDTPSAQTAFRIDDTSALPSSSESDRGTYESSSVEWGGESGTEGRTARTPSGTECKACTCSYYRETTESISHYASFGPKAIAPFLKLATSERGACAECGAAWERVIERSGGTIGKSWHNHENDAERGMVRHGTGEFSAIAKGWDSGDYRRETTGWRPRCQCGLPESSNVPCRTLDCFGGSGTVGVVSEKLGLDCTLIDLSPDYVGMTALRLQLEGAPLFANGNGHDDRAGELVQLDLLAPVKDKHGQGGRTYAGFNARWKAKHEAGGE